MDVDDSKVTLEWKADHWLGSFTAMASPCEVLVDADNRELARRLTLLATEEALRIEHKFSRYRNDNIVSQINRCERIQLDHETAELIQFADTLHELSHGMFDITSGVLRKAWQFDGSDHVPDVAAINDLLPKVGWRKAEWSKPYLTLAQGMEIDLGGIGKEYAVDRCAQIISQHTDVACLINFGGDLSATASRNGDRAWQIGIESAVEPGESSGKILALKRGALATSGDARRFVLRNGKRYGHILNPKTGWPIEDAPRSVTVVSKTCTEAGMLATIGILQGRQCEAFLQEEGVQFWTIR